MSDIDKIKENIQDCTDEIDKDIIELLMKDMQHEDDEPEIRNNTATEQIYQNDDYLKCNPDTDYETDRGEMKVPCIEDKPVKKRSSGALAAILIIIVGIAGILFNILATDEKTVYEAYYKLSATINKCEDKNSVEISLKNVGTDSLYINSKCMYVLKENGDRIYPDLSASSYPEMLYGGEFKKNMSTTAVYIFESNIENGDRFVISGITNKSEVWDCSLLVN